MQNQLEVGVIGLGKFGFFLAERLMELGHQVVGLDGNPDNVRRAQESLTQVYQGDAMDKKVLEQLGFADLQNVVVSVGSAMEASILICLHLKELGVSKVWVKAVSWEHEKVLRKIGGDEVFFPERYGAHQVALQLTNPGLIEYMQFGHGVLMQKLVVDQWAGKTLRDLDLSKKFKVQVVAVRKADAGNNDFTYLPSADDRLGKGDELVVIVQEKMLEKLKP